MADTILQATSSWKMARKKVFNFLRSIVEKKQGRG